MIKSKSNSTFAVNLCRLMNEKQLTIREVADSIKVPKSTIDGWRSGKSPDNFIAVSRLAEMMGVSFQFLLTGNEEAKGGRKPTITEVLSDGGELYDGIVQIKIRRLVPKGEEEDE